MPIKMVHALIGPNLNTETPYFQGLVRGLYEEFQITTRREKYTASCFHTIEKELEQLQDVDLDVPIGDWVHDIVYRLVATAIWGPSNPYCINPSLVNTFRSVNLASM
jgi:hypothetical protein